LIVFAPLALYLFYNGYALAGWGVIAFACLLLTVTVLSM
jgi:hypothetical protein